MKKFIPLIMVPLFLSFIIFSACNDSSSPNDDEKAIHVSLTGVETNSGMKTEPVKSIQTAITRTQETGIYLIKIASGTYTPGNGINTEDAAYQNSGVYIDVSDLTIKGGWNQSFTSQNGTTELDGQNNLDHIVFFNNSENVTIEAITLKGGNANGDSATSYSRGGGIYINGGTGITVSATVTLNHATIMGGGIYINGGSNHTINGIVSNNTTQGDYGGGIYLTGGTGITIGGSINGNSAEFGGGVCVDLSNSNTINAVISGNSSTYDGAGIYINHATSYTIRGTISNNTAGRDGGGILVRQNTGILIDATVSGNTAATDGGGIHAQLPLSGYTINGIISNNTATNGNGGGVYIVGDAHVIEASISDNTSGTNGGGVYAASCTNTAIDSTISENTSVNGGGLCVLQGDHVTISGSITDNITGAGGYGGGIFFDNGSNHTISAVIRGNQARFGGGIYIYHNASNSTFVFSSPTIEGHDYYGIERGGTNSDPGGIATINWGSGNTPANLNWTP